MAIPSRQIGWGAEENLLWQISKQLEMLTNVAYNIGQTTTTSTTLNPNSIQFGVDTTGSTFFIFSFETLGSVNYTINWGDGTTHVGSVPGGYYQEEHTYPQVDQQYTALMTFDNVSDVTILDFWGND